MRKVVSFDKNLEFKTMVGEVTSISLDPNLHFSDDSDISGELVISGKYKLTAASRLEDDFLFSLPVEIALSEKLEEDTRSVSIDDFRYEVEDGDKLNCHIDLVIEGVEKIDIPDEEDPMENILEVHHSDKETFNSDPDLLHRENSKNYFQPDDNDLHSNETSNEVLEVETIQEEHSVGSLFSSFKDSDESFSTYSVYIVRENDTLESIMTKYKIRREELEDYNDLDNLITGTKIIIPTHNE